MVDEARVLSYVNNRHVVKVHDVWHEDDYVYVVMDLIEGYSLDVLLNRKHYLPQRAALELVSQLCDALSGCHAATDRLGHFLDLVHRDVKPGNVMVSPDGTVTLLDFGFAKWEGRQAKTDEGTINGTLHYMAPEQIRGEPVTMQTDIYAVGALLYFLVTGHHLNKGMTVRETYKNIVTPADRSTMPRRLGCSRMSEEVREIVMTCIATDPNERFTTVVPLQLQVQRLAERSEGMGLEAWCAQYVPAGEPDTTPTPATVFTSVLASIRRRASPSATQAVEDVPEIHPVRSSTAILTFLAGGVLATVLIGVLMWLSGTEPVPDPSRQMPVQDMPATDMPEPFTDFDDLVTPAKAPPPKRTPPKVVERPVHAPSPPVPQENGSVSLVSIPWSKVWIDGTYRGPTPQVSLPLAPGDHDVHFECGGCETPQSETLTITIEPGTDYGRVVMRFN